MGLFLMLAVISAPVFVLISRIVGGLIAFLAALLFYLIKALVCGFIKFLGQRTRSKYV